MSNIFFNNFIFKVLLILISTFLSTFGPKNLKIKIILYSITIITVFHAYFSIIKKANEDFSLVSRDSGSQNISYTGVGHRPLSLTFNIKDLNDQVVAEKLELNEIIKSDERRVNGKLLKLSLLSLDEDGFTLKLINETGFDLKCNLIIEYNKLNDLMKTRATLNE